MCMGGPSVPAPPPPPPPPPEPARQASDAVKKARRQTQTRARSMAGDASTRLTGPRGLLAPAQTGTPTLLGG